MPATVRKDNQEIQRELDNSGLLGEKTGRKLCSTNGGDPAFKAAIKIKSR